MITTKKNYWHIMIFLYLILYSYDFTQNKLQDHNKYEKIQNNLIETKYFCFKLETNKDHFQAIV